MESVSEYITEGERRISVAGESDVLVIGGGLAGTAAAIAAARNGATVRMIEKSVVLGGLATLGHVCIYLPLDDGAGHKIYGGLAEELLHCCIRYGYDNLPECWKSGPDYVKNPEGRYRTNFNIPAAVLALDEMMENEHIDVVFDTVFCDTIMADSVCRGVIVENKSGRTAYLAKMVVDATGDADVFFRAGAECEDQATIVSHWTHEMDFDTLKDALENRDLMRAVPLRWFGLRPDADNSRAVIPMYHGTNSEDVNAYIRTSRKLARDYLKGRDRKSYAMMTMPYMPQWRMTRRLKGMAEMKVVPGVHVDSSVGCVIHSLEAPAPVYEFPYEGLIDSHIENVIAAGRMVSAGGRGWEIMRFIPACVLTGEAAGTAAALAVRDKVSLQQLSVRKLQHTLSDAGVKIHMDDAVSHNQNMDAAAESHDSGLTRTDSLAYKDLLDLPSCKTKGVCDNCNRCEH